jgi:AAA15 family ATPase/GTPase
MSYLSGIGFNNFRVFGEQTDFKFTPITILTGTNNSGKSSLIKL